MVALRVLITVADTTPVVDSARSAMLAAPSAAPSEIAPQKPLPSSFQLDPSFAAVPLGQRFAKQALGLMAATAASPAAFAVRAVVDANELDQLTVSLRDLQGQNHVFADPGIGLC